MNNVNSPNPPNNNRHNHINLNLSLAIHPEEQDSIEEQDPIKKQDHIEEEDYLTWFGKKYPITNHLDSFGPSVVFSSLVASWPFQEVPQSSQPIQPASIEISSQVHRSGQPPEEHEPPVAVNNNVDDMDMEGPYPWAKNKPATIHDLGYLTSKNIDLISGQVYCRSCDKTETLKFDLKVKFLELSRYIDINKEILRQRAPDIWKYPNLPTCGSCNSFKKPVISHNKEEINWLFLLLGQMLGCCTLEQLKYFCDKTTQHRTGCKERVLYQTYMALCKQLEPGNRFDL